MLKDLLPGLPASTLVAIALLAGAAGASADESAGITSHELDATTAEAFDAAEAMGPFPSRLPMIDAEDLGSLKPARLNNGVPGSSAGTQNDLATTEAYGQHGIPYTTSRVAVKRAGYAKNKKAMPITSRPYSSTGKLFVKFGRSTYVCTASLIKRGVLVTAAHCVSNFGKGSSGMASAVRWYPAQYKKTLRGKPFGGFNAVNIFVPTPYLNGSDTCEVKGVVCNNDVATIALKRQKIVYRNSRGKKKKKKGFAGQIVGNYDYGYDGYSYVQMPAELGDAVAAQITQLGYPVAFDKGYQMQRTDSIGYYYENGDLQNTFIGSAQTGGSSGGPWLVNFGTRPIYKKRQASLGSAPTYNVVVGVTSWGVKKPINVNYQGSSFFGQNYEFDKSDYGGWGAGNIGALMRATCSKYPRAC